jgi:predicted nuclease of restriction endonuclease-like (RecB) superfamily
MEQLILNIKHPKKLPFIKELLSAFDEYVEVVEKPMTKKNTRKEKKFLAELDKSVTFVNNYKKEKTTTKTFKQMLNEL